MNRSKTKPWFSQAVFHIEGQGWMTMICSNLNLTGWWYTYPSEKYDFVSWDDDIPNI